jgi:UDP-N-acetylglucosamine 2-epimerase (non-hydrolysing)/GDP/UDP-N,N'-diacetylbacillosamine 2-epimerase (hydrolysing)
VITGTRAEYGLLQSTMRAIDRHPRLKLQLVVTGMHLLKKFGHTIDEIRRDGWRGDAVVPMQRGDDGAADQATGLARGVEGIARFLGRARTDIVVVLGDRIEAMAGALAAVATGRILAHIHGGDVATGDFDDSFRHAITKLAHVHFPATRSAARRIIAMGEPPERVHVVGAPGLDRLVELVRTGGRKRDGNGAALVIQHPCGRAAAVERRVMATILEAVRRAGLSRTIIYPNSDRGHTGILTAISEHVDRFPNQVRVHRSLDRDTYLRTLVGASVLVGNSSSGIIEAATAGTPVVNVGSRQQGRERSGPSVVDAAESAASIGRAMRRALQLRPRIGARMVYGDGTAGNRIAVRLAALRLDERLRRKTHTF